MIPQIPYAAIGTGIAVIFGVWAFIVGTLIPSFVGRLIALIGWVIYGLGCIIFLRYKGVGIR